MKKIVKNVYVQNNKSLEEGLYWGDFPFGILTIEIRHILKEDNYHLILHGFFLLIFSTKFS